jgi:hypothetical protein
VGAQQKQPWTVGWNKTPIDRTHPAPANKSARPLTAAVDIDLDDEEDAAAAALPTVATFLTEAEASIIIP